MNEEFDTQRQYTLNEFIFDDEIKDEVNNILIKYRSDFIPNVEKKIFVRDIFLEVQGIPLLEELKFFYNNDVCFACATSMAITRSTKFNLRTHAYYYENALYRIEEAWEYTHIILNVILGIDLVVGRDIRESIINGRCCDLEFKEFIGGYKPIIHPYSGEKLEKAIQKAEKDVKLLSLSSNRKKSVFHKILSEKKTVNLKLRKLIDLYYNVEADEFHKLRNEVVHRRSLGAKFTVAPCIIGPGQSISIDPKGWFCFNDKDILLEKNLVIIREAIQVVEDLIFNHDLPNLKKNEEKKYYCVESFCNSCNSQLVIAEEMVSFFKDRNLKVPCPLCGEKNMIIKEKVEVNDQYYINNFWKYNEDIKKYAESMFEEVE